MNALYQSTTTKMEQDYDDICFGKIICPENKGAKQDKFGKWLLCTEADFNDHDGKCVSFYGTSVDLKGDTITRGIDWDTQQFVSWPLPTTVDKTGTILHSS